MTSIGVEIVSSAWCGELAEAISGVISRAQYQGASVVGPNWSSAHRLAWVTIALNRSVCPATQLPMYPPNEPPIAAVRVSSMSSRATAASVADIRSVYGAAPQAPQP